MKIVQMDTFKIAVPLIKPFKTALRTVNTAEAIYVKIICDTGVIGWEKHRQRLLLQEIVYKVSRQLFKLLSNRF